MGGLPGGGPDRQLFQPAERAAWLGQFRVAGAGALHRFLVGAGKGADQLGDAGEILERDGGMVGCHGAGPPEARAAGASGASRPVEDAENRPGRYRDVMAGTIARPARPVKPSGITDDPRAGRVVGAPLSSGEFPVP
jgi:hypothetical protein